MSEIATFDIAPVTSTIIMVAGVGGGGGNAVNHMYRLGATDVSFMVCNTDKQALERSPIPNKILLGNGLGAGNRPERARQAAMESIDQIKEALTVNDTKMLFVTAGMGGGTGTGAAPVVARIAKDMGILTVGIVSIPFKGEGPKRVEQAIAGIKELSGCVDSLIVINNEHIAQIYGKLGISQALAKADDILAMAAKSIADIITTYAVVNVDFADVTTVMKDSGVALMGSAVGGGEDRALTVSEAAVNSPLLHHNSIEGAQNVLLNITSGTSELSYEESLQIIQFIQERSGLNNQTDVIWGAGYDESLGENIRITVVATGFQTKNIPAIADHYSETLHGVAASSAPVVEREVIDFEALEPVAPKKVLDDGSADGFELVTREGSAAGAGGGVLVEPMVVRAERIERMAADGGVESGQGESGEGEEAMVFVAESTFDTPAWKRRNITLYNEPRDPSVKSEKLDGMSSASTSAQEQATHVSLFD